ncbi:hypothetical protein JCM11491_000737 [Sporobolomyces phaffii]
MFKYWRKSPKTSPDPATVSPRPSSARAPSTSVNNPSQSGVTGLGITDGDVDLAADLSRSTPRAAGSTHTEGGTGGGTRVESRRSTLEVPSDDTARGRHSDRRDSVSHGVTFSEESLDGSRSAGNDSRPSAGGLVRSEDFADGHGNYHNSLSPGAVGGGARGGEIRAVSPMSFSPSIASTFRSPYGPSMGALTDRDPNQIYAPTTWSDMADQELVVNLSHRERTRQEILWEVVASEERYVAELRSLIENYTNPLLHPLLSAPPQMSSPPLTSTPFARQSIPATPSSTDLPIAARFLRTAPSSISASSLDHLPEIRLSETQRRPNSLSPSPRLHAASASESHLATASSTTRGTNGVANKLASFAFGRARQATSTSSCSPNPTREPVPPAPPLPRPVRAVLESTLEMLKGHEELSAKLKEQWSKSFPLVRGLAATWSDQPWFLQIYSDYIVSLEEALDIIDAHLPAAHPHSSASTSPRPHLRFRSSEAKKQDKLDERLSRYLQHVEREAALAGESSLSICLSKPLMRMSKLPLLMQALLFHTDPTTHEWEKTRAMALEVDALVRSIEDEKIEEDQRERTRDVLARIDGINDRGLMAPRTSRVLHSEQPAPPSTSTSSSLAFRKNSTKRSSRRVSATATHTFGKTTKLDREWLIAFNDVVIRAEKVGETNVPGSFSREKEKQGKHGKTRKAGPLRNTYRFLRVERWETAERAEAALTEHRDRNLEGTDESDVEGATNYAESRMSFRYDSDEPQPTTAPRDFTSNVSSTSKHLKNGTTTNGRRSVSSPLPDTQAKFGGRLRLGEVANGTRSATPIHRHRFDSPTLSSTRKAHPAPLAVPQPPPAERRAPTQEKPKPRPTPPPSAPSPAVAPSHLRDESTYNLYKMWSSTQE